MADAFSDLSAPYKESDRLVANGLVLAAIRSPAMFMGNEIVPDVQVLLGRPVSFQGLAEDGTLSIPVATDMGVMAATDEATPVGTDTARTLETVTISTAAYDLAAGLTDTMKYRDPTGFWQPIAIAVDLVIAAEATIEQLVCALFSSFDEEVSDNTTPLTWDIVKEGANVIVPAIKNQFTRLVLVVHSDAWAQLEQDFADASGSRQYRVEIQVDSQFVTAQGYKCTVDNIAIFANDEVPDDGSGHANGLFNVGSIAKHVEPSAMPNVGEIRILDQGGLTVEADRTSRTGTSSLIARMRAGAFIVRQAGCCRILSGG